jgi:DNA-binding NarL/FixJ family response regulator
MDLTIPGGMGGKETIQKLLKIDPEAKAIVSSGYSNDPIIANFQQYGFSGCAVKPYKIEELESVLLEVLKKKNKNDDETG